MKQPELGAKISAIRNQKGITQMELSESSNIDIRTVQRIEAGEVTPRMSTLRLIAETLSCDVSIFNNVNQRYNNYLSPKMLMTLFVAGVFYFISWLIISPILPQSNFLLSINLFIATVYVIAGVCFYYGFYNLGKLQVNPVLKISSIVIMILIPLFLIALLISSEYGFAYRLSELIVLLMGINSILFGIGLLKRKDHLVNLYKITGVLQVLLAPFFIIPVPIVRIIGFWLSIPFILLLLSIVYLEFRESQNHGLSAQTV